MLVGPNIISTFEFFSRILFYVAPQAGFQKKRLETVKLDFIDQSYLGIYLQQGILSAISSACVLAEKRK